VSQDNWKRRFGRPLHAQGFRPIETLADARAYLLMLDKSRPDLAARIEWQNAIASVMDAAKGKSLTDAREKLHKALVLTLQLDFSKPD
jgi:hypothetical protein